MGQKMIKNKPVIFNPAKRTDIRKIEDLLFKNKSQFVIDQVHLQLEELFYIRHPALKPKQVKKGQINNFIKSFFPWQGKHLFGIWVFYPWNNHLVHFLPEDLHTEVRTARNRNLITAEEQIKFYNATVGIAGLSVGNSAMATLLYTGGPKNMHLADHDILSGSNINRIRTGFSKIGMKKVDICAQEIYEINPYANLKLYRDGLNKDNLEKFLITPEPLDVLIEEMDNIYLKIQIRLLARKHRIPVVMAADNGDNIVLDIERFDLEPNRPIFHGDIAEKELLKVTPDISKAEAAQIISRLVHPENVAPRMQSSLFELGKTLFSWPQLGNAAFLAGCALSYSTRKIILGHPIKKGKFLVSLDEILIPGFFTAPEVNKRKKQTANFKKMLHLD